MKTNTLLVVLLGLLTFQIANAKSEIKRCGVHQVNIVERLMRNEKTKLLLMQKPFLQNQSIEIPVYFHIISTGGSEAEGNLSDKMVMDQLQVMNDAFAFMDLHFRLMQINRVQKPEWFRIEMDSALETEVKSALRAGGPETLNIYSAIPMDGGDALLGFATFPEDYVNQAKNDGVVVHYQSFPGGSFVPYNLGYTAVHEIGHWVGLYHTFEGGCSSDNDLVADTAAEAGPNFGCPANPPADSCRGDNFPGVDPIHNFMDYTDDDCMNEFSAGQTSRAGEELAAYRL